MDEQKARLQAAADALREERRKYNRLLVDIVNGAASVTDNAEDLVRLTGSLEAAYNHCLASIAGDGDIYCIIKHLSYSIILAGEMDSPDLEPLYDILAIVSNGTIEPCQACRRESTKKEDNK